METTPGTNHDNIQIFLGEHLVEIGIARLHCKLFAITSELLLRYIVDSDEISLFNLLTGAAVCPGDSPSADKTDSIAHVLLLIGFRPEMGRKTAPRLICAISA